MQPWDRYFDLVASDFTSSVFLVLTIDERPPELGELLVILTLAGLFTRLAEIAVGLFMLGVHTH